LYIIRYQARALNTAGRLGAIVVDLQLNITHFTLHTTTLNEHLYCVFDSERICI